MEPVRVSYPGRLDLFPEGSRSLGLPDGLPGPAAGAERSDGGRQMGGGHLGVCGHGLASVGVGGLGDAPPAGDGLALADGRSVDTRSFYHRTILRNRHLPR
jgi:hypothetical protein